MITKQEFLDKYGYSKRTYQRRMSELKNTPIFCKAYLQVTSKEVRIDEDLYDEYLKFTAYNRNRFRKVSPQTFLKGGE